MSELSFCDCYRGLISNYSMPRVWAAIQLQQILECFYSGREPPDPNALIADDPNNEKRKGSGPK